MPISLHVSVDGCPGESRICSKIEALNLEDSTFAAEQENGQPPTEGPASEEGPDDEQQEEGGWSVAAFSHNAARRRRRKQAKYDARVAASSQADAASQQPQSTESVQDEGVLAQA